MRPAGASGPAVAVSLRSGNMCAGCHCAAGHVRGQGCATGTVSIGTEPGAPCVQDPSDRLCPGHGFVTSAHGTATRNTLRERGPVVLLKCRNGSKPLRQRRFRLASVEWARVPIGLHSESGSTHPTQQTASARMRALACPDGHFRRLEAPGCCWDECTTPEPPDFPTFRSAGNPPYYAPYYRFTADVLPANRLVSRLSSPSFRKKRRTTALIPKRCRLTGRRLLLRVAGRFFIGSGRSD